MIFSASDSTGVAIAKGAGLGAGVGLAIGLLRPQTPLWLTALAAAGTVALVKAL